MSGAERFSTDHARNQRRYGKADDELVGYFSSAIGVKAQNFDSSGGGFNSHEAHYGRLRAIARGDLAWFDRVGATLAALPAEHRHVLALVYRPHGAPTWLADALLPPWGSGSFVQLSLGLPRAVLAAAERKSGDTVLDFLVRRGRRAKDALLTSLREDAEALRLPALAAYDVLRVARVKAEQAADREAKRQREERNAKLYEEMTGRRLQKERARFERRMRAFP